MIPLDQLKLFELEENPDRWEALIAREQNRAEKDSLAAKVLESVYWERDREFAFQRFDRSLDLHHILDLMSIFQIDRDAPLVEIGGGSGFLAWALSKHGYNNVSLLEPNSHWTTGTGYLRSRSDANSLRIENSLAQWYASKDRYQTVVTRNCIHHFPNIAFAAAAIRQKLALRGMWVVIREPFVETCHELYRFFHTHPYSQRYGVFEFAFPASHFVNSLELAGFQLKAVVPCGYANNVLSLYQNDPGSRWTQWMTGFLRSLLCRVPVVSRSSYRIELAIRSILPMLPAFFTRPQVMLFQRRELGELPPEAIWYPTWQEDERLSRSAEDMGFEPTTGFPAPDFESGS